MLEDICLVCYCSTTCEHALVDDGGAGQQRGVAQHGAAARRQQQHVAGAQRAAVHAPPAPQLHRVVGFHCRSESFLILQLHFF